FTSAAAGTALIASPATSVSYWMNWNGGFGQFPIGFSNYALNFLSTNNNPSFGFYTNSGDIYGIATSGTVTGATNAGPIVLTTSLPHGLSDGARVLITGVGGNT